MYGLLATKGENADTPDDLSLYVADGGGCTQSGKADRFRRYTLRPDGFVSATAPLSGGEVITRPFTMRGPELSLNLATSAAGSIQVETQTAMGKPIEGLRTRGLSRAIRQRNRARREMTMDDPFLGRVLSWQIEFVFSSFGAFRVHASL